MLFRQLFDAQSSTYTYLLADETSRAAVLIDPVREQSARDSQLLRELELNLIYTLETHVHADHITAGGLHRTQLGSKTVVAAAAEVDCADVTVGPGDHLRFGSEALEVRATPGHTRCSLSFVHHESRRVFSGDALLIRGCGRTDFQHGDPQVLYRSVHAQILALPDDYAVYPGHDYQGRSCSTVGEEKRHNPRLGHGRSEAEFVEIMNALELPRPKLIDVAVPGNQRCGFERLQKVSGVVSGEDWAPIARTPGGVAEVSVEWVRQNHAAVQLVDVRSAQEFEGELGHVKGARLFPLAELADSAPKLDREAPTVTVCRSGGRSGKAAQLLEELGFTRVASMAGGMLRWNGASAAESTPASISSGAPAGCG